MNRLQILIPGVFGGEMCEKERCRALLPRDEVEILPLLGISAYGVLHDAESARTLNTKNGF